MSLHAGQQRPTSPDRGRCQASLILLRLDMRLGEGSGAALAVPIVQSAARLPRDVATFDSAGVSGAKE